ncbi:hypothetical protein DBR19_17650, partial [Aeromonas sp. HMWF014]
MTPCCWVSWGACCNCACPSWFVAKAPSPAAEPLPTSLADELAAFIEYLRVERQLSPHTRSNYRSHLDLMAAELVRLGLN